MGRHKSPPPFSDDRLTPPATLSPRAAEIFKHVVSAVDVYHFTKVDLPLVCQYVGAAELCELAQEHLDQLGAVCGGKPNPWLQVLEKASRSCVALSARLRICPQSRFDRLVAGTNSRKQVGRRIWETEQDFEARTVLNRFSNNGLESFRKPARSDDE